MLQYLSNLKERKPRKDEPGRFSSAGLVASDSSTRTYLKTTPAIRHENTNGSRNLPVNAQTSVAASHLASSQKSGEGDRNTQSTPHRGLGFGSSQQHQVTDLDPGRVSHALSVSYGSTVHAQSNDLQSTTDNKIVNRIFNRFQDRERAIQRPLSINTKILQLPAVELPAGEISKPIWEDLRVLFHRGSSSRMPLGELGEQNDDRATNNQIQGLEDPVSNVTEADKRSLGDEIQIDNSCQHQDLDVLRSDQTELILANPTLRRNDDLNGSADCTFFEEISQNEDNPTAVGLETNEHGMTITGIGPVCNPMDVTFPQTSERSAMLWGMDSLKLRWSRKQGAKLVKKDQYELFLKQRCDVLEKERRMDQMKIGSLTQELKHLGQEIQQIQHDLEREKREFGLNVTTLELELNKTKQIASEAKSRLRECEEQRDNRLRENDKLSRSISHLRRANQSVIEEAQRDLKTADDKHAIEVSRLNEEHARSIIQLEQDKKSMAAKAEKDLEMMNDKHAAEISRLNEDRKRAINALTSKLQNEMSIKTQQLQAMIDEKSRVITAQDLRMASYNKQIHSVIADGDLGQRFRALCLKIDNLINAMPRPQEYTVDAALDPTDFMGRNSSRRSRIWHKFLCKVCWDVLIRGFFHRQPGFGSFGWQGDGYLTLLQLYRLFAKSNAQGNFPR